LMGIVQSRPEGTTLTFEIIRGTQRVEVTCVLPRYAQETK